MFNVIFAERKELMKSLWENLCSWLDQLFFIGHLDPEMEDVRRFQKKFDHLLNDEPTHLTRRKLRERLACLREELNEFEDAVDSQDLVGQFDALLDLVYFAKGTAQMLGLRAMWSDGWDEVQRANMSKVNGIGKRGHQVDVVKPAGWVPPRHEALLRHAGYRRFDFEVNGEVHDALCSDDAVYHTEVHGGQ
jgi:predicted HAD superfamily Cof-like phosphohydrolase